MGYFNGHDDAKNVDYYDVEQAFNTVINELKEQFMHIDSDEFEHVRYQITGMEGAKEKVLRILFRGY